MAPNIFSFEKNGAKNHTNYFFFRAKTLLNPKNLPAPTPMFTSINRVNLVVLYCCLPIALAAWHSFCRVFASPIRSCNITDYERAKWNSKLYLLQSSESTSALTVHARKWCSIVGEKYCYCDRIALLRCLLRRNKFGDGTKKYTTMWFIKKISVTFAFHS